MQQELKSFKILIAGLDGVGKRTIIQKFEEGYKEYKERAQVKGQMRDGEDNLRKLQIELVSHTISSRAIDDDEYIAKKPNDLNQYKIIVIVFDLGEKDSIKEIAKTIQGSSLNFSTINPSSKCALWGNKKDLFNFNGDVDERTAQKVFELEKDYQMVGYVKTNSLNPTTNEPFQQISVLIQEYLRWLDSVSQSNCKTSSDFSNFSDLASNRNTLQEDQEPIDQKKYSQNKNKSKHNNEGQITSFKCGADKQSIPTRPKNGKKAKKMDDEVYSAKSGTSCSIF